MPLLSNTDLFDNKAPEPFRVYLQRLFRKKKKHSVLKPGETRFLDLFLQNCAKRKVHFRIVKTLYLKGDSDIFFKKKTSILAQF
jgi:hypothetical protein